MLHLIKEHLRTFWAGFIAGGVPTCYYVLRIPSMPQMAWIGDILKGTQIVIFSTVSGLALVLVTDIYKNYWKDSIFKLINKMNAFVRKIFKYGKEKQTKEKDEGRAA